MNQPEPKTQRRRHLIFAGLAVLALALLAWAVLHKKPAKASAPHAIPVTVVKAVSEDFPVSIMGLGAAQAWTSDTIFAQVSGKLISVNFAEGTNVKAGQVLAEVDPRPYRAALAEAQGTLAHDVAQLAGARRDLLRYRRLQAEGAVPGQTADDEAATVAEDEGTVAYDRGVVATAKLNLDWCRITSPIAGRTEVRLVDPGNLVSASGSVASTPSTAAATNSTAPSSSSSSTSSGSSSGTGIVIVNQVQPIAVTFTVPQGQFQQLDQVSNGFSKTLQVQALSQETGAVLDTGELRIADNRVDPSTGTVELKARFPNPKSRLWPGQFVNVNLTMQTLPKATVVPTSVVNRGPKGQYVFAVGPNNKVVMKPVTLAWTQGQTAVIKSGVQPGDTLVTDGQMILTNGSLIRIAKTAPAGDPAP